MSATGRRNVIRSEGSGRRAGRIGILAMALAAAWALIAAVAAQATTVTVGSVLPPAFTSTPFEGVRTQFNTTLPETGANLASPVNGAIVRWKVQGAIGGPFTLRVLHPNGSGAFTASGTSQPAKPVGAGIETFATQLPIRAGDLIGIDSTNPTDEIGVAALAGAGYGIFSAPPFEGATNAPSQTKAGQEIELSAEVQPAPAITAVSPNEGSVIGGEKVTITGTNLNGASAVMFGEVPAASFTVVNEEKITAVAPKVNVVGTLDITATTLAGESPVGRADRFDYRGCTVPTLVGKKLALAKAAIRAGGCKVGKVTKILVAKQKKKGKVVKQNPKPGRVLVTDAKVAIKIAKVVTTVAK
ncbi:MAG TPA: IPT/TIG domain-containing protein [Solirubrobacterales bacterium]|nr:IPT/TIG domain-containing protein [Solirubrobacterales bacterium]